MLLLSPTQRQSGELFRKCLDFYRAAGRPVEPSSETALTLTLQSGSRIVSLPGHEGNVRGYSAVRLSVIDEASRVSDESIWQRTSDVGDQPGAFGRLEHAVRDEGLVVRGVA